MAVAQYLTLSTLIGIVALINGIAMFIVWRIHPSVAGPRLWLASQIMLVLGWLPNLAFDAGIIERSVGTAWNNSLNLAAMLLLLEGALVFRNLGAPRARRPWLGLVLLIAVTMSIVNRGDPVNRYLFHDAVAALLLAGAALAMRWRVEAHERGPHGLTSLYLAVLALAYVARWGLAAGLTLDVTERPIWSLNMPLTAAMVLCGVGALYGLILSINAQAQHQVILMGLMDPLTGLDNRRSLEQGLMKALALRTRTGGLFGLIYFDLDRFKPINDRLGHAAGDAVLVDVARRLRLFLRASDQAARIGGDEFVVLLHGVTDKGDLAEAAARLRRTVEGTMAMDTGEAEIHLSLGMALAPLDGEDADTLLRHADARLYQEKQARRTNRRQPVLHAGHELDQPTPS